MNRRIFWIVLGALLLILLVILLWWWFLGRTPETPTPSGGFGTSDTRPGTGGGGGTGGNVGTYLLGNTPTSPPSTGSGGGSQGTSGTTSYTVSLGAPGVSWLGGSGGVFNPTRINEVDGSSLGGLLPNIGPGTTGGDNSALWISLLGAGISGGISCAAFLAPGAGSVPSIPPAVNVKDSQNDNKSFLDCIARVIAKVAINQMTASIVQWINSGFKGQPSFVQNYQQFFTNVADQAAGEFIKGSSLSFLCSPFQAQVRVAIAQSYARRNQAASCSLSGVVKNLTGFLNGNFSQGGWKGLLAFTTTPTNNPYGAYMYGEAALRNTIASAQDKNRLDLTLGRGFLSIQEEYGCTTINDPQKGPTKIGCKYRNTTPGSAVAGIADKTLGIPADSLNLAKSFDEIISALIQQLVTRTLQQGLSNLTGPTGNEASFQPLAEAQAFLNVLQAASNVSQQYGFAKQGSIRDIQNAQQNLQNLANCWDTRNNSSKKNEALQKIADLETRVALLNNNITRANSSVALIQGFNTRLIGATTPALVAVIKNDFETAQADGLIVTEAELSTAQQDRTTLQSEMAALNQQTNAELTQCHAS